MKKDACIIVLVTAKNHREASLIAKHLLAKKLIACANLTDGVGSVFCWQGKIEKTKETLMILKTRRNLFRKLTIEVKRHHSYQTPEIIALPIVDGSRDYLNWIGESTC